MDDVAKKVDRLAGQIRILYGLTLFLVAATVGMIIGVFKAAGSAGPRLKVLQEQSMLLREENNQLREQVRKLTEQRP